MAEIVIDPQISSVRDDGTEAGIARVSIERSGLVLVPFPASLTHYGTGASSGYNFLADGSGNIASAHSAALLTVDIGITSNMVIDFSFSGRKLGFLCFPNYNTPMDKITVVIDGTPYPFPAPNRFILYNDITYVTAIGTPQTYMIADDLDDGVHQCEIQLVGSASEKRTYTFTGMLLETRVGYRDQPLTAAIMGTYLLPATSATTLTTICNRGVVPRIVTQIIYCNVTGSPVTVLFTYNGMTVWSKVIAANDTQPLEFKSPLPVSKTLFTVQASVANAVNVTTLGVM